MPKSKPTHVIVHRLELQEKEREMMENVAYSQMLSKGVPALLLGGGVALAAWGVYWFFQKVYDIASAIPDLAESGWDAATSVPGAPRTANRAWDTIKYIFG